MKRNSTRQGKGRINVWLEKGTLEGLKTEARGRGVPVQGLIEGAVAAMFRPELREDRDELILRRLNLLDTRLQVLERLIEVDAETLAFFIRQWFASTVEVPQVEKAAAWLRGEDRFKRFLNRLSERLAAGSSLFTDLPEGVVVGVRGEDQKLETFSGFDRTQIAGEEKHETK